MTNQWLGILLNDWEWEKIVKGCSKEQVELYLKAADKYGLPVCFFRLEDINLLKQKVNAFIKTNKGWKTTTQPLPKVIHNRAIFTKDKNKTLREIRGKNVLIYNAWNNYSKSKIHQLLQQSPALNQYLPLTYTYNKKNLLSFLKLNSFFLKPDRGSTGDGILKLTKLSNKVWRVLSIDRHSVRRHKIGQKHIVSHLKKYVGNRSYILQETIDLVQIDQAPIDIRISVQKNGEGVWQVSGLVAKHAKKGHYLCNVAQGGSVLRIEEVCHRLQLDEEETIRKLSKAALEIVEYLDAHLLNLADVGLDLGLDQAGNVFFIEMNSRDQRYSFQLASLDDTFTLTYENPIHYGYYLLHQNN